jgi:hypothetical protein
VTVESSKNHIVGFSFKVLINYNRPNCVGVFLSDYIVKMGVKIRDKLSFVTCKVASTRGVLMADPAVKVSASAMRSSCKKLIASTGLDARDFPTHLCKRGGALAALEGGLSQVQVLDLSFWASATMVSRYAGGDPAAREAAAEFVGV